MAGPQLRVAKTLMEELRLAEEGGYDIILVHDNNNVDGIFGNPIAPHRLERGFMNVRFSSEMAGELADHLEEIA